MSDQSNNKFDGYITLGNALTESFDKIRFLLLLIAFVSNEW